MVASASADAMTTDEVARVLGVSVRQVQRLVESGGLAGAGRVGRSVLVDADSVNLLRANGTQRGRPWNARTVWVALDLLSGVTSADLTSSQRWHLRERLRGMSSADLVRISRRRADVHRFRASESFFGDLREELALTGAAALSADAELASGFGLAAGGRSVVDGYLHRDDIDRVVSTYHLVDDVNGNVVLRVVDDPARILRGGSAALATVALDLAESVSPRERSAARRMLGRLLSRL